MRNLLLEYKILKLEKLINERVIEGDLPKYFYHGTSAKYADNILKTGLVRRKNSNHALSNPNKVYLTTDIKSAKSWARMSNDSDDYVVLKIDSSYLNPDLLTGDTNAIDPFANDNELSSEFDYTLDDNDKRLINDLIFDDGESDIFTDFEYAGDIPADAISVEFKSDPNLISDLRKYIDKKSYRKLLKVWDDYKWSDIDGVTVAYSLASDLSDYNDINKVLKAPAKILNTLIDVDDDDTVLTYTINYKDNIVDVLEAVSKVDGIDDNNISLIWKKLPKNKQSQYIEQMSKLPKHILEIGKPFIVKKYHKQLGI